MFFGIDKPTPRFERQLKHQEELVLHEINKGNNTKLSKERLHEILEILYEFRVVD